MSNENKLTEEDRRAIEAEADYFAAHVEIAGDKRTSIKIAFAAGFMSALSSVGVDIEAEGEPPKGEE